MSSQLSSSNSTSTNNSEINNNNGDKRVRSMGGLNSTPISVDPSGSRSNLRKSKNTESVNTLESEKSCY
jgi:hypothetical protein